jgi:hypothetical protein
MPTQNLDVQVPVNIQIDPIDLRMSAGGGAPVNQPTAANGNGRRVPWWGALLIVLLALMLAGGLTLGIIALARGASSAELKKASDEVKTAVANAATPILAETKKGAAAAQLAADNALATDTNAAVRHTATLAAIKSEGATTRTAVDGVGGAVRQLGAGIAQHNRTTEQGFARISRELQALPSKVRVIVHPGAGTLRLIGGKVTTIK